MDLINLFKKIPNQEYFYLCYKLKIKYLEFVCISATHNSYTTIEVKVMVAINFFKENLEMIIIGALIGLILQQQSINKNIQYEPQEQEPQQKEMRVELL